MSKNVLQTIRSRTDSFSRGQKRIADYILMNYDKAAFMTAGHLGRKAQVSESTVVRFASQLGYDGYPNMQRALQELVRGKLTSLQRIQVSRDQMQEQDVLTGVMQRDMNSIHTARKKDNIVIVICKHLVFYDIFSSYLSSPFWFKWAIYFRVCLINIL